MVGSILTVILLAVIENFSQKFPPLVRTIIIGIVGLIFSLFVIYSVKRVAGLILWVSAIAYIFLNFSPLSAGNAFSFACVLFLPILAHKQSAGTLIVRSIFSGSILLIGFEAVQYLNLRAFSPAGSLIEGLFLGVFAGVSLLSRHIETHDNRMIQCLYDTQKASKSSDLKVITSRTINLHSTVIKNLEEGGESFRIDIQRKVDELVCRISNLCRHVHQLELELEEISLSDITRNIDTCDANIKRASSTYVISMLHKARMTAVEQKDLLDRIIRAKQELTAQALIDVTRLERLRIVLLQLRTSNLTSAAPSPEITEGIEEFSTEIEARCNSVDEVFYKKNSELNFLAKSLATKQQQYEVDAVSPETIFQK